MDPACTNLTEAVRSVHLLKIDGYCATAAMTSSEFINSRWNVDGHEWEIHFYPRCNSDSVALKLVLLSEAPTYKLRADLSCRLVDPSGNLEPSVQRRLSNVFRSRQDSSFIRLMRVCDVQSSGYLKNDSLTVECTITVLKELSDIVIPAKKDVPLPMPCSDLHQHLGELLQSQEGADVTFAVSGESFPAHKLILAARSPVFMAEFFGRMQERSSQCVHIEDMEASVFKAMLHFIYTDTVPELDDGLPEAATMMAQHLLAAAGTDLTG